VPEVTLAIYVPRALQRDVDRIASYEKKSRSRLCAGLLRLGIERYFEMEDAKKIAPLRALMRDTFINGLPDPETYGVPVPVRPIGQLTAKRRARYANEREFDAAMEEGLKNFEATRG